MPKPNAILPILESAQLLPAREAVYPIAPTFSADLDLPPHYTPARSNFAAAARYLRIVVPGLTVRPLSNEGKTAIVMHDVGPIAKLPTAVLGAEFNRFVAAALRYRLLFGDCRILQDRKTGRAIATDVGAIEHPSSLSGTEGTAPGLTLDDQALIDAILVQKVFIQFGAERGRPWPVVEEFIPAITHSNLNELHPLLYEYCGRTS